MIYKKFEPSIILSDFVECYFIWKSVELIKQELIVESPPSGFCSIVFNFGDVYYLQNKKYDKLEVPHQFVCGQSIYSYKLFLKGKIDMAGIVFKPAALASFFGLPTYEFTEERTSLSNIFPSEIWLNLVLNLEKEAIDIEKVRIIEKFLLDQFEIKQPKIDYVDKAANLILAKNGTIKIDQLVKDSSVSRRTFERNFFAKVGLSPKYYARIRRITHVFNQIAGKKSINWADLFIDSEFYDQAHFIKDFEEFTGRTPQQYLQENIELANLVKKPITEKLSE